MALPPTANTLSSYERFALVRSSKKLTKVLGDVPRVLEDDIPSVPSTLESTRTYTATSTPVAGSQSAWRKRKPTHLPPLLKLSNPSIDSLPSTTPPLVYHRPPPSHRTSGSVLSAVSNAPSSPSATFPSETSSERRAKLERLRRRLGNEVPATAVFPPSPRTPISSTPTTSTSSRYPATPRARTRSFVRPRTRPTAAGDDSRSIMFSINSDESTHTVTFAAARVQHTPPHPRKPKNVYQTGPLPPVPPLPVHLSSGPRSNDDDADVGLIRPRQKMSAGSRFGGADFKAARRAKRDGRSMGEPGEFVEMVGFMF